MGLFGFGKKKEPQLKSPTRFYTDCVVDFHEEANKYGVANRGVIFIPELLPLGEKTILAFMNSPFFKKYCGSNLGKYYYLMMYIAIEAGIVLATRWHEQFSTLNQYVDEIIAKGPAEDATILLRKHFPRKISKDQGNPFIQKIYPRWVAMHEPYWKLKDPRAYTMKAMLAAFQLGVSMILEKYGY